MSSNLVVCDSPQTHVQKSAKEKRRLKSVLGFYSANSTANSADHPPRSAQTIRDKSSTVKERRSVDVAPTASSSYFVSLSYRRKKHRTREERASVTDVSFYESASVDTPPLPSSPTRPSIPVVVDLNSPTTKMPLMLEVTQERASRRKMARIEAQDGPWSVSVAENDKHSFSIYIKTPTHHITLTRSTQEIFDLHRKLTSTHPELSIPDIPLQAHDENIENGMSEKKRKSSFLHTLSRLASPGPNRRDRPRDSKVPSAATSSRNSLASNSAPSPLSASTIPTPISPSMGKDLENWDPFSTPLAAPPDSNSATCTALASYLTTLANEPALKQSKTWRRFVRVRTDDLISERVERAVKRVRSDLAAHLSGIRHRQSASEQQSKAESSGKHENVDEADEHSEANVHEEGNGDALSHLTKERSSGFIDEIKEEDEEESVLPEMTSEEMHREGTAEGSSEAPGTPRPGDAVPRSSVDVPTVPEKTDALSASSKPTEILAAIASRIPRSQSADPDKATRMSRIYQVSPMKTDGEESALESESEAQVETEIEDMVSTTADDASSVSTSAPRSRKRGVLRKEKPPKKAKTSRKVVINDFEMMRVLGKGCAGKVLLVRHKKTESLYALKAITKRHVLAHQELQHTLTEQAVLKRMAREGKDPFVVKLWWSFHDKENLFLVMDFHPGGDLATQLARWGRLGRDRARFYAAEIVEGVDGLHQAGVIYRDLKPENILIGGDGHIVLTDFGLSKEFPRRATAVTAPSTPLGSRTDFHAQQPLPQWMKDETPTNFHIGQNDTTTTFCGTAEYLAPEVIQGLPYSYEVDWWSFGTMLYEMLTGITPFWANNHPEMYVRVLQDELKFPEDRVLDQDTKSLIRGLLQRNPALRIKQPRIKKHPYFSMIDWGHVYHKRYIPPYIPPIDPSNAGDTQNFDETFLDMEPVVADDLDPTDSDKGERTDGTDKTDGESSIPAQPEPVYPQEDGPDLFDGYSFKGRHSVLIDDEDEDAEDEDEEDEEEEVNDEEDLQRLAEVEVEPDLSAEGRATPTAELSEPKTPEARKPELPELTPAEEIAAQHRAASSTEESESVDIVTPVRETASPVREKAREPSLVEVEEVVVKTPETPAKELPRLPSASEPASKPLPAIAQPKAALGRKPHGRREKSGVTALDKYLSDAGDEDEATERDDEDDDWDFVEAPGIEDRNGARGTSLFARGVVDRYRLAVFRKASTPAKSNSTQRNVSGISLVSEVTASEDISPSASPSDKRKKNRNPTLTFRRNPKQFLKARSPPSTVSSANGRGKSMTSNSNTLSSLTSSASLITPSTSGAPSSYAGPSLKSKESTTSMGSPGSSDDQSLNGDVRLTSTSGDLIPSMQNGVQSSPETSKKAKTDATQKSRTRKLRKYRENAEKVFSIFQSPRQ